MSSPSSLGARLGLSGAVVLLFALAVVGAERWIEMRDPELLWRNPVTGDDGMKFYRFHPKVGLFHKSDFAGDYLGVTYTMNALGARGPLIAHARQPGTPRILLLGDSVTWGFGVADDESLPAALSTRLRDVEVVNLGVAGFGTAQELVLLREEGLAYQPDHVVLVFTLANDVEDTYLPDTVASFPANFFYLDPDAPGGLGFAPFDLSPLQHLGLWLRHNSYLVSLAIRAVSSAPEKGVRPGASQSAIEKSNRERLARIQPDPKGWAGRRHLVSNKGVARSNFAKRGGLLLPTPLNHYKVELVEALILAMRETCREAGVKFSVALAPFRAMVDPTSPMHDNPLRLELVRFLSSEGGIVLDLLPHLEASGVDESELFVDAMHLSAQGNRVVAEALARWLSVSEHQQ